jgi:hypothetical protein
VAIGRTKLGTKLALVVSIAALTGGSMAPPGAAAQSDGFPIYGEDKWLGSVNLFTDPTFTQYFNRVTPENAGTWGSVAG